MLPYLTNFLSIKLENYKLDSSFKLSEVGFKQTHKAGTLIYTRIPDNIYYNTTKKFT